MNAVVFPPIRKVIASNVINTDTSLCIHLEKNTLTNVVDNQVHHIHSAHGLYVNEHECFLAYWSRPVWNHAMLRYEYENGIEVISLDQAKQWLRNVCPDKLHQFTERVGKNKTLVHTISIRADVDLRNYLEHDAEKLNLSLSRTCIGYIEEGMAIVKARTSLAVPLAQAFRMPLGMLALDDHGVSKMFLDPNDIALARQAEKIFFLMQEGSSQLFPFIAKTMAHWVATPGGEEQMLCVSDWIALFYKSAGDKFENSK